MSAGQRKKQTARKPSPKKTKSSSNSGGCQDVQKLVKDQKRLVPPVPASRCEVNSVREGNDGRMYWVWENPRTGQRRWKPFRATDLPPVEENVSTPRVADLITGKAKRQAQENLFLPVITQLDASFLEPRGSCAHSRTHTSRSRAYDENQDSFSASQIVWKNPVSGLSPNNVPAGFESAFVLGVFDGHGRGGDFYSDLVSRQLPQSLGEVLLPFLQKKTAAGVERALRSPLFERTIDRAVVELDRDLWLKWKTGELPNGGTTAVVAIVFPELLVVINIGDSRAFVFDDTMILWRSVGHEPDHPEERARIEKAGGVIQAVGPIFRINGGLNLSRALGDFSYKYPRDRPQESDAEDQTSYNSEGPVTPHPTISVISLPQFRKLSEQPLYLLLSSDWMMDKLHPENEDVFVEQILETFHEEHTTESARAGVCEEILSNPDYMKLTGDDATVIFFAL